MTRLHAIKYLLQPGQEHVTADCRKKYTCVLGVAGNQLIEKQHACRNNEECKVKDGVRQCVGPEIPPFGKQIMRFHINRYERLCCQISS